MISGAFHVASQEWRYFSREKSIVHTLHLAQLATGTPGEWVTIMIVPPSGSHNGFQVPHLDIPSISPYNGLTMTNSVNNFKPNWAAWSNLDAFQSGTYGGWSGVVSNEILGTPLKQQANWLWPAATGGIFVVYGDWRVTNTSDVIDTIQNRLVKTTDYGLGATSAVTYVADVNSDIQQEGQYVIVMQGAGWNNQMYIGEAQDSEHITRSMIMSVVPAHTWVGSYHDVASPYGGITSSPRGSLLVFRLGP